MVNLENNEFAKNFIRILKGGIIAIILTIIMLVIFSFVLTYTSIQENTINPVIITISGISILVGSILSTMKIHKNGILNGILVGLLYFFTIYTLSSIISGNFSLNVYSFIMLISSCVTGIIGGIIGVNI